MKYFVILFVVGITVCVSAHSEHEKDIRPYCFRNLTAEEKNTREEVLKGCAEKKRREGYLCKMTGFKMLTPDGKLNKTTVLESIEKIALAEYKEELKKGVISCMPADNNMKDYLKCSREHEKTLPCNPHKYCHPPKKEREHKPTHGEEEEGYELID